ncbi:MAG: biliverdin-producing heme oxygenase [Bryobacteraceae bacterium]|nr:biliverdin-producing heme oxygenase [Bryobacteraceae bacterium]
MHSGPAAILSELRSGTRDLHERVEAAVDWSGSSSSLPRYVSLLRKMLGFHKPVERLVAGQEELLAALPDIGQRQRVPLLERDLRALGAGAAGIEECRELPPVQPVAAGLGVLYVLEGSTLGGQVLARMARERLGVGEENGGSFFLGYGARTGEMWKRLTETITAHWHERPDEGRLMVGAARDTFSCFEKWLQTGDD